MRKEIKTAIIGAIIIIAAIGGISAFFTSLDKTVQTSGNEIFLNKQGQPVNNTTSGKSISYPDENQFSISPRLSWNCRLHQHNTRCIKI